MSALATAEAPVDPAEERFEPTGDLYKDYCAYCEIEDKEERGDVLDSIGLEDLKTNPRNAQTPDPVHTTLFVRSLESPLHKKDISPLTNAIPHCSNLYDAKFFSCRLTVDSWKLLVEAVYKSPSLITVHVDFNPELTKKDPTVSKREGRAEHLLWPSQARGGRHQQLLQQAKAAKDPKAKDKGKGKEDDPAAGAAATASPVKTPDGWDAMLLTFVRELSLRGNGIDDAKCKLLGSGLERNTELLALNLWGNLIGDSGAIALATALRVNCRLTALNLGDNRLTDRGVTALIGTLRQQDMSDTDGADGFRALRSRVRPFFDDLLPEDPPAYPTFADLAQADAAPAAGKDAKKPPPKGKGGKDANAQRARAAEPWDRDCVKVSETVIRAPGNKTLWSLNLSNNKAVTPAGVAACVDVLEACFPQAPPPPLEAPSPADATPATAAAEKPGGKDAKRKSIPVVDPAALDAAVPARPPPPCDAVGSALDRLLLQHPALPADALAQVDGVLQRLRALRAKEHPAAP